jgi:hypothetical protein
MLSHFQKNARRATGVADIFSLPKNTHHVTGEDDTATLTPVFAVPYATENTIPILETLWRSV